MSRRWPGAIRRAAIRRDLRRDRVASVAVVLAVALAVATFATFVGSGVMVRADLADAHARTLPGAAVLVTDRPIPTALIDEIARLDGIAAAAGRSELRLRVRLVSAGTAWTDLDLTVVDTVGSEAVERSVSVDGVQPGRGDVLIDRTALGELGGAVGERVELQRPDGSIVTVRIAGRSAQPGRAAWFDPPAFGVTTFEALAGLGLVDGPTSVVIRVAERSAFAGPAIEAARERLIAAGLAVGRVDMLGATDRSPADRTLETVFLVLAVLGSLAILAASLLVANEVGTIVIGHRRRIGVLRAIGADPSQVRAWYLAQVALLAGIGTVVGLAMGGIGARLMSGYVDGLVNVDPVAIVPPAWVVGSAAALGIGIAVLSALRPVGGALAGSVRSAIDDHGLASGSVARSLGSAMRPTPGGVLDRLATRNLVRRPRRSLLTLATIAVSGAMVIGTLDAQAAIAGALEHDARFRGDAVAMDLRPGDGRPGPSGDALARALDRLRAVPGVAVVDAWVLDLARLEGPVFGGPSGGPVLGPGGPDGGLPPLGGVTVLGVPPDTALLRPTLVDGNWLDDGADGDRDGAIVSATFLASEPGAVLGGPLRLTVGDVRLDLVIRGVIAEPAAERLVIVGRDRLVDAGGSADALTRVVVGGDGSVDDADLATSVQAGLEAAGLDIDRVETRAGRAAARAADARGSAILGSFMIGSAIVVGLIGAIGLVGMLAGNVADRRREIAVLRAIGAAPGRIVRLLLVESMALTALSAVLAMILAVPLALLLGSLLGDAFLDRPLGLALTVEARLAWSMVAIGAALVATVVPARRAAGLVLRDELAYE